MKWELHYQGPVWEWLLTPRTHPDPHKTADRLDLIPLFVLSFRQYRPLIPTRQRQLTLSY